MARRTLRFLPNAYTLQADVDGFLKHGCDFLPPHAQTYEENSYNKERNLRHSSAARKFAQEFH
jgi:hypothetical protein